MILGFTGTRSGMNEYQKRELKSLLEAWQPLEFHHGDCVGADAEAHAIALEVGIPVVIHPPVSDKARAFCQKYKEIMKARPYLIRNQNIVTKASALVAAPATPDEILRSGTWATVRYARKEGKPIHVLGG